MANSDYTAGKSKPDADKLVEKWKGRIEASEKLRNKYSEEWKENVSYRAGEPFQSTPQNDTVFVPADAALTKQKIASLFSVVPAVSLTTEDPRYSAAAPVFAKRLNHVLQNDVKTHVVMEEVLGDVINAAGVGIAKVGYDATFEDVQVPGVDVSMIPPDQLQGLIAAGQIPMVTVKRPLYESFYARRISPTAFLWPAEFKGSDFEEASWLGWKGEMSWPDAKRAFNLSDEDRKNATGGSNGSENTLNDENDAKATDKVVCFTEIFYRCSVFDANENDPRKLKRLVLIEGLDRPAVLEDFQWQRYVPETRQWIGVPGFPIKVLTLQYISDRAIPPSDSKTGRPQVRELMRSRSQMIQQRESSKPLRWFDTNRLDPIVADKLRRGEWQDMFPVNGDGSRIVGEVARAVYPAEQWQFDAVVRQDLERAWALGDNQLGRFASGERSASEANIVQQNASTLVGFQRAKVARFFLSIAEAVAGLIVLFGLDSREELAYLGDQGEQRLSTADLQHLPINCVFTVRQDAQVLLDSQTRLQALNQFLNLTGKSGFVQVQPIIAEMATLVGLDPTQIMTQPQPPAPDTPNISLRLSGNEDLTNPITVALLMKSGQAPSADEIKAAKLLLSDASAPLQPEPVPQTPGQVPVPNQDWGAMPRVSKRADEGELGG